MTGRPARTWSKGLRRLARRFLAERSANIAVAAAASLPVVTGCLALGVDVGTLTLERRAMQGTADLAAIAAAGAIATPHEAVRDFLALNGLDYVVATEDGYLTPAGTLIAAAPAKAGIATVTAGTFAADPAIAVDERFAAGGARANAARVRLEKPGALHFASLFAAPPTLAASATAHTPEMAAFSIASRLVELDGGLVNALLGQMLGTELSLSAMDYRHLVDLDVSLLETFNALATRIDATALTYDALLAESVTIGDLTAALGGLDIDGPARHAITALKRQTRGNDRALPLAGLFDPGPLGHLALGGKTGLAVTASAMDILSAAARLAAGRHQAAIAITHDIGLARLDIALAIGEPPQNGSFIAVGQRGIIVRTAQTRLAITAELFSGVKLALPGVTVEPVRLPLHVEIAHGEARLANLACNASANASVTLEARPGIVEAAIGEVAPGDFRDFSRTPRVEKAKITAVRVRVWPLVDLAARVEAAAHVEATSIAPHTVAFSAGDIADGAVKSVGTRDILKSLLISLIGRLDLDVEPLGPVISGILDPLLAALVDLIAPLADPLDAALTSVLETLGIGLGVVDLRVPDARCDRPVLVQ
ncbi:pilus assembly protein TadG-related protein [Pararhizobium haloflavum]|uniref:pilus assembly protein TadG-related protein n=1 Tax=Pararhizobium haloflavum TaxID=2037914 RepID=UPI000C17DBB6|nr:pilus assembly protein TadG-related protein [Pararhizobium haloflavum]